MYALNFLGNRLYADMKSASKTLIDQFEDNCIMKKAALDNVKMNYQKKLDDLTKQREKIVEDSRKIFENKRKTLDKRSNKKSRTAPSKYSMSNFRNSQHLY